MTAIIKTLEIDDLLLNDKEAMLAMAHLPWDRTALP